MATASNPSYAGDVSAADAWNALKAEPKAQLVDVRTGAEWNFVGLPDLEALDRRVHCVEWQSFPSGAPNSAFVAQAQAALASDKSTPVFLLCRSGARSRAAAIALTQAGFERAFNVGGGFEGDADDAGHRGQINGWKAAGLPWRQG